MDRPTRCDAANCRKRPQNIAGDCDFCNGHFCGKHRLLEDHTCSGLEDVSIHPVSLGFSHWWLVGLAEVLCNGEFEAA